MRYIIEDLFGREREVSEREFKRHQWGWRLILWPLYGVGAMMFIVMLVMFYVLIKEILK